MHDLPDPLEQAREARINSRNAFIDAVDQGEKIRALTDRFREHGRLNHFGEGLERAMMRKDF